MEEDTDATTRESLKAFAGSVVGDMSGISETAADVLAAVWRWTDTTPQSPSAAGEPGQYNIAFAIRYRKNGAKSWSDETESYTYQDLNAGTYLYLFLCYAKNSWCKICLEATWP